MKRNKTKVIKAVEYTVDNMPLNENGQNVMTKWQKTLAAMNGPQLIKQARKLVFEADAANSEAERTIWDLLLIEDGQAGGGDHTLEEKASISALLIQIKSSRLALKEELKLAAQGSSRHALFVQNSSAKAEADKTRRKRHKDQEAEASQQLEEKHSQSAAVSVKEHSSDRVEESEDGEDDGDGSGDDDDANGSSDSESSSSSASEDAQAPAIGPSNALAGTKGSDKKTKKRSRRGRREQERQRQIAADKQLAELLDMSMKREMESSARADRILEQLLTVQTYMQSLQSNAASSSAAPASTPISLVQDRAPNPVKLSEHAPLSKPYAEEMKKSLTRLAGELRGNHNLSHVNRAGRMQYFDQKAADFIRANLTDLARGGHANIVDWARELDSAPNDRFMDLCALGLHLLTAEGITTTTSILVALRDTLDKMEVPGHHLDLSTLCLALTKLLKDYKLSADYSCGDGSADDVRGYDESERLTNDVSKDEKAVTLHRSIVKIFVETWKLGSKESNEFWDGVLKYHKDKMKRGYLLTELLRSIRLAVATARKVHKESGELGQRYEDRKRKEVDKGGSGSSGGGGGSSGGGSSGGGGGSSGGGGGSSDKREEKRAKAEPTRSPTSATTSKGSVQLCSVCGNEHTSGERCKKWGHPDSNRSKSTTFALSATGLAYAKLVPPKTRLSSGVKLSDDGSSLVSNAPVSAPTADRRDDRRGDRRDGKREEKRNDKREDVPKHHMLKVGEK